MTPDQKKAFAERMKLAREKKKLPVTPVSDDVKEPDVVVETPESSVEVGQASAEEPVAPKPMIVLNFTKFVEVGINGKKYEGKRIEVDNMALASEIVRIAKEAYGWDVLS